LSEQNSQYAYFSLHGFFEPEEITSLVGVQPTESWRKGDLHSRQRLERKRSHWALRSRLSESAEIEAHIIDVLTQMQQNADAFSVVSKAHGGCMQIVGYLHEGYPGIHFDSALIQGLAQFHLEMDFDLYNLWSDAREDT